MRILLVAGGLLFCFLSSVSFSQTLYIPPIYQQSKTSNQNLPADQNKIDHRYFSELLKKFTKKSGMLDYAAFKKDRDAQKTLKLYCDDLMKFDVFSLENVSEAKAYWVNLYNALVIQKILEYYPLDSVLKKSDFFAGARYEFASFPNQKLSLLDIEEKVFREKLFDPRLFLVRVSGAVSSPLLGTKALEAEGLEDEIDKRVGEFLSDPRKNIYDPKTNTFYLSPLFMWYQDEIGRGDQSLQQLLKKYIPALPKNVRFQWRSFDWRLNDVKNE